VHSAYKHVYLGKSADEAKFTQYAQAGAVKARLAQEQRKTLNAGLAQIEETKSRVKVI
jgi:hypothetical protein